MGIDIRIPIGGMFTIIGLILVVFGMVSLGDPMYQEHSLGVNVNLWWGLAMTLFGLAMLYFGLRAAPSAVSQPGAGDAEA
jgi:membrane-bound ClpP family serine protease